MLVGQEPEVTKRVKGVVMNDKERKKLDEDFAKAKRAILGIFDHMRLGYVTCFGILGSFLSDLLEGMLKGSPKKVEILEEFLEDFIRQLRLSWQRSKDRYKK